MIASLQKGLRGTLRELALPERVVAKLCEELRAPFAEPIMFEGVRLRALSQREEYLHLGASYAARRWNLILSYADVDSLMKAVPTGELLDLIPLVMNQHFDEKDYPDPAADMDEKERRALAEEIRGMGLDDTSL